MSFHSSAVQGGGVPSNGDTVEIVVGLSRGKVADFTHCSRGASGHCQYREASVLQYVAALCSLTLQRYQDNREQEPQHARGRASQQQRAFAHQQQDIPLTAATRTYSARIGDNGC